MISEMEKTTNQTRGNKTLIDVSHYSI